MPGMKKLKTMTRDELSQVVGAAAMEAALAIEDGGAHISMVAIDGEGAGELEGVVIVALEERAARVIIDALQKIAAQSGEPPTGRPIPLAN